MGIKLFIKAVVSPRKSMLMQESEKSHKTVEIKVYGPDKEEIDHSARPRHSEPLPDQELAKRVGPTLDSTLRKRCNERVFLLFGCLWQRFVLFLLLVSALFLIARELLRYRYGTKQLINQQIQPTFFKNLFYSSTSMFLRKERWKLSSFLKNKNLL